jgi:hypothetical protein
VTEVMKLSYTQRINRIKRIFVVVLMPNFIECEHAYGTLGEMVEVLG